MTWNVQQYERFTHERGRPFHELLARVPPDFTPRAIVDLGCGSGRLTRTLLERWPAAHVLGIDSSEEMLDAAAAGASEPLTFARGQIERWHADATVDLVVSNAALHWIDDHPAVLARWSAALRPGGVLAVQVPANFAAPSHQHLYALAESRPWRDRLGRLRRGAVLPLVEYVRLLRSLGLEVDAWETTYLHALEGERPVLEWMKGTALRPLLAALSPPEQETFLAAYAAALERSYPSSAPGVLFPFRRLFMVARRALADAR